MSARLKERYEKEIRSALVKEFGFANPMQAPRLDKIVVNMGLGEAINNGKILDASVEQLAAITGQRPVVTKARWPIQRLIVYMSTPASIRWVAKQ